MDRYASKLGRAKRYRKPLHSDGIRLDFANVNVRISSSALSPSTPATIHNRACHSYDRRDGPDDGEDRGGG